MATNTYPNNKKLWSKEEENTLICIAKEAHTYPKYYRHFKGGKYKALMEGKDSETQELVVIYLALYGEHGIGGRPKAMLFAS